MLGGAASKPLQLCGEALDGNGRIVGHGVLSRLACWPVSHLQSYPLDSSSQLDCVKRMSRDSAVRELRRFPARDKLGSG